MNIIQKLEEEEIKRMGKKLPELDRKSTRLNSSHGYISYAVFCLKKKNRHISGEILSGLCSLPFLLDRLQESELMAETARADDKLDAAAAVHAPLMTASRVSARLH